MGNKAHSRKGGKPTNYHIEIEYFGDRVIAGQNIQGQAVLVLDDAYVGKSGLGKAVISLKGTERVRYCHQKSKNEPKKIKSQNLYEDSKKVLSWEAVIHDFNGHLTLNGGRYRMPFSIPVPMNAAPSFDLSPVEQSLLEIKYEVEVTVTECADTRAKKSNDNLVHGGVPLISNKRPITVMCEPTIAPQFNTKHSQQSKKNALAKVFSKSEFAIETNMATDLIAPQVPNQFLVKIDNTQSSHEVSQVRIALVRSIQVFSSDLEAIQITNEEVGKVATQKGGPAHENLQFQMPVITPSEIVEKHPFNTNDGKTRYGSVTAPTFQGAHIKITYGYELRVWHKYTVGKDKMTLLEIPVTMSCLTPNVYQIMGQLIGTSQASQNAPGNRLSSCVQQYPNQNRLSSVASSQGPPQSQQQAMSMMMIPPQQPHPQMPMHNQIQQPQMPMQQQPMQQQPMQQPMQQQPMQQPMQQRYQMPPNPYAQNMGQQQQPMQAPSAMDPPQKPSYPAAPGQKPQEMYGQVVAGFAVEDDIGDPQVGAPIVPVGVGMPVMMPAQAAAPAQPMQPWQGAAGMAAVPFSAQEEEKKGDDDDGRTPDWGMPPPQQQPVPGPQENQGYDELPGEAMFNPQD